MCKRYYHQLISFTALAMLAALPLHAATRQATEPARDSNPERAYTIAASAAAADKNLPAGTPVFRVGLACDYDTIQAAINAIPANGSGIVEIRHGSYTENLYIENKSVELIGGFTSCTAPSPSPTGLSAIIGSGASLPAITFFVTATSTAATRTLRLNSINMVEGTGISPRPGGGLTVWTANDRTANVFMNRSAAFDNSSGFHGGGIALTGNGDGLLMLQNNSRIFSNEVTGDAPYGGGLSCGSGYHVVMQGGSINSNTAGSEGETSGRGGGVYLDGCSMIWFSHTATASSADDASLRDNTVHGTGGGLHAAGGASAWLIGADDAGIGVAASSRPLRIHGNRAEGTTPSVLFAGGGGIYANGSGTEVTVDRGWVYDNHSDSRGGAVYSVQGAVVNVERGNQVCHHPRNCSRVFANTAQSSGGIAVVGFSNAELNLRRTKLEHNRTIGDNSAVLVVTDPAILRLDDSLIHGDVETRHTISIGAGSTALIRRSTIADTDPAWSVFNVFSSLANQASLTIWDSIIHETGDTGMIDGLGVESASFDADCVLWHDDALADLGTAVRTIVADPLFAARDQGQYYLQPGSPAINYCGFAPPPPGVDLDWNPRGDLHSDQPAVHGPYDLGAYELPLGIFEDRFEQP